jgi:hypothetical protein
LSDSIKGCCEIVFEADVVVDFVVMEAVCEAEEAEAEMRFPSLLID